MDSVLQAGRRGRGRGPDLGVGPTTAYDLLAVTPAAANQPLEVVVPAELLADLEYHPLIITPDYVGRDRRASGVRRPDDRGGPGRPARSVGVLAVVIATACAVVPLTLWASHAAVAAPPSGRTGSSGSAAAAGIHTVSLQRSAAAGRQQQARARSHARSLARTEDRMRARASARQRRSLRARQAEQARQARTARLLSMASARRQARAERAAQAARAARRRRAHRHHVPAGHRREITPATAPRS